MIYSLASHSLRLVLVALVAGPIVIQAQPLPEVPVIRVLGEGRVALSPDEAWVDLGVVTQAASAQVAAVQNGEKVNRVLETLRKELGPNAAISTLYYNLNPDYRHSRDEEPPTITGYIASNVVRVRLADLGKVGRTIDAAITAGANSVQRVEFGLRQRTEAESRALQMATADARRKAEAIAASLDMKLGQIVSVEEGGAAQPFYQDRRMEKMELSTPIEPGTVDVRAVVTMTVRIVR